jgi:Ca2+-binding RTX toxin-like protein
MFRDFVDVFRQVEQEQGRAGTFKFEFNSAGPFQDDPTPAYPGDAWVDIIGVDIYYNPQFTSTNADEAWLILRDSEFGLNWTRDFAIAHGKQVAVSEWGVRTDQGSSDANSARLMDLFSDWLEDPANLVVQHTYWDHDIGGFPGMLSDGSDPLTGAEYREQFSDPDVLLGDNPPPPPPPGGGQGSPATSSARPGTVLAGGSSFDTIVGGSGDDTISGGHMGDVLTGGSGRNVFKFGTALPWGPVQNDSGGWGGTWGDLITDFRQGWDKIDVSALFTFATRDGVRDTAAFTFVGQDAFSGTRPELRYEWLPDGTTRIQMDGDTDAGNKTQVGDRPDGAILLLGHHHLEAADFIL